MSLKIIESMEIRDWTAVCFDAKVKLKDTERRKNQK